MERIIEIELKDKYDFIDKYNERKVSSEMVRYLIEQCMNINNREKIKIIFTRKFNVDQSCTQMIKNALIEEYNRSLKLHHSIDIKQTLLIILGIISLVLYALIKEDIIWKEVLLIGCWVGIWEAMDLEFFDDARERRIRKALNKLLKSEIVEIDESYTESNKEA